MTRFFLLIICFFTIVIHSQTKGVEESKGKNELDTGLKKNKAVVSSSYDPTTSAVASVVEYKIITIESDTTHYDTSLTIQKEYKYNYLRKDIFGLQQFSNEGQTYNTLDFGINQFNPYPEIGLNGKHFNFLKANEINYYHVPTPLTELYFKTVMEQGQNLDAFITLNTSERLNFSLAYKGLRSLGKYINQLSSTGNFRFTTNYQTKSNRYQLKAHFTAQDIFNGENGGIVNLEDFEGGEADFRNRVRVQVFLNDAETLLKGNRYFYDHYFRVNRNDAQNNVYLHHQINYEHKFFNYKQFTVPTTIISDEGNRVIKRFGDSYVLSNINDETRYNRMFNKIGALYENKLLGEFQFYIEDFRFNYFYNRAIIQGGQLIPSNLSDEIQSVGGQYTYQKNKWNGKVAYTTSLTDQSLSSLDGKLIFNYNDRTSIDLRYQNLNRLPNHTFSLFQSSYVNYNWSNNFKNEKINNIESTLKTQWLDVALQLTTLNDFLYFSQDEAPQDQLIVTPKQYDNTINYLSIKASKELTFRKLGFDNTILYQKVDQENDVLNVPELTLRSSLYISGHFFKKALFLQTGVTVNYFSKYYANDYNPVLGDFYVQNTQEIGDFPMVDFFINAKIKTARMYLKAEHFNSAMTGFNYYSAPNNPYRDFMVRFGLEWNFFL
jgi:hypothetical protein